MWFILFKTSEVQRLPLAVIVPALEKIPRRTAELELHSIPNSTLVTGTSTFKLIIVVQKVQSDAVKRDIRQRIALANGLNINIDSL